MEEAVITENTLSLRDAKILQTIILALKQNQPEDSIDWKCYEKVEILILMQFPELEKFEKQLKQFVIDTKAHRIPEKSDLSIRDFSNIISKFPQDYSLLETWMPKLYKQ